MEKLKPIYASAFSASVTIILITVVTMAGELSITFKNWLAEFTGHHWVTKSWIAFLTFIILFIILRLGKKDINEFQTRRAVFMLQILSVICFFAILGFYTYEFFAG